MDDIKFVATRYLLAPTSFSFDFVTSLPWSYMDIYSYEVRARCTLIVCSIRCKGGDYA